MNTDNKMLIKISESLNPSQFEMSHRLQVEAYEKVQRILIEHSEKVKLVKNLGFTRKIHEHNSIFVSGSRGCGKTTFLLNIEKILLELNKSEKVKAHFLKVIDPTLMHDSDNFISIVLGRIFEEVYKTCQNDDKLKRFKLSFAKVANIISAITDAKTSSGLDNILDEQNALKLEEEIHNLLEQAVNCLEIEFLVLPIDDIDMSFNYGFDVLERVRKYLTSPYILPIISGDFRLYEQVFASKFFNNFTKDLGKDKDDFENISDWLNQCEKTNDTKRNYGFAKRAIELSDLYLEKVLPKHRRIDLLELKDIIEKNIDLEVNIFDKNGYKTKDTLQMSLKDEMEQFSDIFNLGMGKYCSSRIDPFPRENLRGFIQFLAVIEEYLVDIHEKNGIDYKKFFQTIANFYSFANNRDEEKVIHDFSLANSNAFCGGQFSVKKLGQDGTMSKYFDVIGYNKIIPFYAKTSSDKKRREFPPIESATNLEKLFYIISFEATIMNGSRIFISPDKFFIWLSAKLFSPEDFANINKIEIYIFGFDNILFNYDTPNDINTIENDEDSEESPELYEKIKYAKDNSSKLDFNPVKDLDTSETSSVTEILKCSTNFFRFLYRKYRDNVNEILKELKKIGSENEPFKNFVVRLIYAYVNAFAIATIKNPRFTENNICVKHVDKDKLKTKDLAYRWNILRWDDNNEKNPITTLLDTLIKNIIGSTEIDPNNIECRIGNISIGSQNTSIQGMKRISRDNTPPQIKQIITNNIKSLKEKGYIGDDLINEINKIVDYETLGASLDLGGKRLDRKWLRDKRELLGDAVYDATFGQHFKL